jgi:hypothetical protein
MPNGGVPINLEFWMGDINSPGTHVYLQHSRSLSVQQVGKNGPSSAELIGTIEITRPFLTTVVTQILEPGNSPISSSISNNQLAVKFQSDSLHLSTSDGTELTVINGEFLSVLAAFMAYWVDHDGVEVPTGLPIRYLTSITDDLGRNWDLNWAF